MEWLEQIKRGKITVDRSSLYSETTGKGFYVNRITHLFRVMPKGENRTLETKTDLVFESRNFNVFCKFLNDDINALNKISMTMKTEFVLQLENGT